MKIFSILVVLVLVGTSSAILVIPPNANENIDTEELNQESSEWLIERISAFGGSSPPSIAIDSMNRPHVLYCPPGEVWYATRIENGWEREKITDTVGGGLCGSMDIGPDDIPHIFFAIPPPGSPSWPHYVTKKNDSWLLKPVTVCRGGDITVDGDGEPHIACFNRSKEGKTWEIRHVTLLDDSWHIDYVDTLRRAPSSGWISILTDSSNNPHILYYADTIGEVRYAYKDNGTWKIEVVDVIGNIQYVGRQGSLALDSLDSPHAAYYVRLGKYDAEIRHAARNDVGWSIESVDRGSFPNIGLNANGDLSLVYRWGEPINPDNNSFDSDLTYAIQSNGSWLKEIIFDGYQYLDPKLDIRVATFPSFEIDSCGNPHIAFYLSRWDGMDGSKSGVYYATKGEPCPPEPEGEPSASLEIHPRTFNLKSKGRWITTYLSTENASVYDIDISSILLQDTLVPERWDYQGDVLMLKFNRQEFKDTVEVGESVEIKISGRWNDGNDFEAYDFIRVMEPGGKKG